MNQTYLDSARLLTQVAPLLFVDDTFALKGGTAINLFVRDMPRLSVDLDLVFPDHTLSRDKALARIQVSLRQAANRLKKRGFQTHASTADVVETKLQVRHGRIEIKVEVNFVMRGTVRPVRRASLTPTRDMSANTWSFGSRCHSPSIATKQELFSYTSTDMSMLAPRSTL